MTPIDQSIGLSIGATAAPSLRPKEKAMYNEGFVVAVILGLFAFLLPVLWIGWWLLADLGDRANRTHGAPHYQSAKPGLGPAA
jgi:Kef-type K+ transport system membrane component KefB